MSAIGANDIELSWDITPHLPAVLELDAGATVSADEYLFDRPEQAEAYRQLLADHNLAAFSEPHGLVALLDGRTVGLAAGHTYKEAMNRWMAATMTLHQTRFLADDPALAARFKHMARVNATLEEGDYYWDRVAVADGMRGKGIAPRLFEGIFARARELGCSRLVGEASVTNGASLGFIGKLGMQEHARGRAHDEVSGRSIEHIHLAMPLVSG